MARKQDAEFSENNLTQPESVEVPQPVSQAIHLLHDYGGRRTNEQRIAPGVYRRDDPALFGLADYLVANGHAVAL